MTLQEAQQSVDEWIKTYGVRYFNELTNMACLTEEVGELARVIARKYGEQSFKPGDKANLGDFGCSFALPIKPEWTSRPSYKRVLTRKLAVTTTAI